MVGTTLTIEREMEDARNTRDASVSGNTTKKIKIRDGQFGL